jgi:DNA (cytosine-5)-methyltransferase 3A
MDVISLFDGCSCARLALSRGGWAVKNYYASEIDPYAIQISKKNYPDIKRIGDVRNVEVKNKFLFLPSNYGFIGDIDLLISGSPCQDLSIAKKGRKGLEGERSGLFWEYVRILKEVKPRYFVLENVASMPAEAKAIITKTLGVEPIMINASLVSAQNRKRLFWTNIPGVTLPEDKGIVLKDILLDGNTDDLKSLCVTATYYKKTKDDYVRKSIGQMVRIGDIGTNAQAHRVYSPEGKSVALSALGGGQGAKTGLYLVQKGRGKNKGGDHHEKSPTLTCNSFEQNNHITDGAMLRKLHPIECERLQGMPDNYTEGVSNTQRYKICGNAFNVDVVTHILSFMKFYPK